MNEVQWIGLAVVAIVVLNLIDIITGIKRGKGKYVAKRSANRVAPLVALIWGMSVAVLWFMVLPFVLQVINAFTLDAGYGRETLTYLVSHDLLPMVYVLTGAYVVARIIARPLFRPWIAYSEQEQQRVNEENEEARVRLNSFLVRFGLFAENGWIKRLK